jgi:hypothetical protein
MRNNMQAGTINWSSFIIMGGKITRSKNDNVVRITITMTIFLIICKFNYSMLPILFLIRKPIFYSIHRENKHTTKSRMLNPGGLYYLTNGMDSFIKSLFYLHVSPYIDRYNSLFLGITAEDFFQVVDCFWVILHLHSGIIYLQALKSLNAKESFILKFLYLQKYLAHVVQFPFFQL